HGWPRASAGGGGARPPPRGAGAVRRRWSACPGGRARGPAPRPARGSGIPGRGPRRRLPARGTPPRDRRSGAAGRSRGRRRGPRRGRRDARAGPSRSSPPRRPPATALTSGGRARGSGAWRDAHAGVVVLAGAGDRAFSAGGDQSERSQAGYGGAGGIGLDVHGLHGIMRAIPKPVIAMVNGWAIGGGHVLHLLCALTTAARTP